MLKKRQAGGLNFSQKKHDFGQFFHTHNIEKGTLHQKWVRRGKIGANLPLNFAPQEGDSHHSNRCQWKGHFWGVLARALRRYFIVACFFVRGGQQPTAPQSITRRSDFQRERGEILRLLGMIFHLFNFLYFFLTISSLKKALLSIFKHS